MNILLTVSLKYISEFTQFHRIHFFSVYFEEGYYQAGHFQSIVPTRNSRILNMIKEKGGFDVAEFLEFDNGEFYTVSYCTFIIIIKF